MKIFIDTSAFVAIIIKDESLHRQVIEQYNAYKEKRARFLTSDYVLDEVYTRCMSIGGSHRTKLALSLIHEALTHDDLSLLLVEPHIFKEAEEAFLKFAEHKLSFTNATTYILYKDFAIDEIFTLDEDFKKIGAKTSF